MDEKNIENSDSITSSKTSDSPNINGTIISTTPVNSLKKTSTGLHSDYGLFSDSDKYSNSRYNNFFLLSDEPIQFTEEKTPKLSFHFENIGNNLIKLAQEAELPFTMGIFAEWGRGKTTLMNLMLNKLREENKLAIMFSPWRYDNKEDISVQFIKYLFKEFCNNLNATWLKKNKKEIKKLLGLLITVPLKHAFKQFKVGKFVVDSIKEIQDEMKEFKSRIEKKDTIYDEIRNTYNNIIQETLENWKEVKNENTDRVFILIDDLDRCHPTTVINFFDKIKQFFNTKNVVYIIGIFPEIINYKIQDEYRGEVENYIDKHLQFTYSLPPLTKEQIKEFVNSLRLLKQRIDKDKKIETIFLPLSDDDVELLSFYCKTPREVKLFLNSAIGIYNIHIQSRGGDFTNYLFLTYLLKKHHEIIKYILQCPDSKELYNHFNNFVSNGKELIILNNEWQQKNSKLTDVIDEFDKILSEIKEIQNIKAINKLISDRKINKNIKKIAEFILFSKNDIHPTMFEFFIYDENILKWLTFEDINAHLLYFFGGQKKIIFEDFINFFENLEVS